MITELAKDFQAENKKSLFTFCIETRISLENLSECKFYSHTNTMKCVCVCGLIIMVSVII